VKYFFDNCIAPNIVKILLLAGAEKDGHELVHIAEAQGFDREAKDPEWIPKVAAYGWVAVTVDRRIRAKPQERKLLADTGMRAVVIADGVANMRLWDQVGWWIRHWPKIAKETAKIKEGQQFLVKQHGDIELFDIKRK
jgi:hypothetical protein